jgi:hypothetical protein
MADIDFGSNFDLGSFDDLAAVDLGNLSNFDFGSNFDLGSFEDIAAADLAGLDLSGLEGLDLSSLKGFDLGDIDLGDIDLGDIDFGSLADLGSFEDLAAADLAGLDLNNIDFGSLADLGSFEDLEAVSLGNSDMRFDGAGSGDALRDEQGFEDLIQKFSGEGDGATRSMINLSEGAKTGGLGLTPTGRGQMSIRDPETGATGVTAEGFTGVQDLLGSGTAEEIARYTPGTADYSIRSGLETPDGLGLSSDATRGMGLEYMGGGQGISQYKPAEYGGSVLEDLVKRNPGQFGGIEDYLNKEIFDGRGLTPFKGTGGTLSRAGFLNQSSAENPLGAQYAIGDPKSFINRPSITGQQAAVSPGRTVIDNKNGTFDVVTEKDGNVTTKTVDSKGNTIIRDTGTGTGTRTGTGTGTGTGTRTGTGTGGGLGSLLPLLLALLAMNQSRGGGGKSSAVIPALTATQTQTPYDRQQRAPGYRPGQGGVRYFEPTRYTPKMAAGGGIARLLQGPGDGVSDSIPAVISNGMAKGGQPAKLARGEYVIDARTVAALGNGSTDAGAERLDKMRKNILRDDKKTGVGKDSKAYRHLMA